MSPGFPFFCWGCQVTFSTKLFLFFGRFFFSSPTTNGGIENGMSVGICTHCIPVFARWAPDLHAQSVIINKISASELSQKFIKSALLVGSLLKFGKRSVVGKQHLWFPPLQPEIFPPRWLLWEGKKMVFSLHFFSHLWKKNGGGESVLPPLLPLTKPNRIFPPLLFGKSVGGR